MKRVIECVPNFSEGRNLSIIKQITEEIESVEGVRLLNVDPGEATNRTVVTFAGDPASVVDAAFRAIKKASEIIDMSKHKGEHPRMGATDVCPLIPISGVTMEECVVYARELAEKVGKELSIPVYCYENAAYTPKRKNLADCRSGEYEGLEKKFKDVEWKPDFGPTNFDSHVSRTGASAIGAREFLIAVNYNLNTTSTRRANAIAFDVREKGRKVVGEDGKESWTPGTLKGCKAIGWFIKEYGIAQVSMNITDILATPLHIAFDEVVTKAHARGVRVTGAEIVGLIPLKVLIDAGKFYLQKQQRSLGVTDQELVKIAVKSMGLDDLRSFDPNEKVVEYLLNNEDKNEKLVDLTCRDFVYETSSESPAPGGGSVSAMMGAMGASLSTMVANLSSHKAGWDSRWRFFSDIAERSLAYTNVLLNLVDKDTQAFNTIMEAFSLPKDGEAEKLARSEAIQKATKYATEVPLETMKSAFLAFEDAKIMVQEGNPQSVSDAAVGAIALRGAVYGAYFNVLINASGLKDKELAKQFKQEAEQLLADSIKIEKEILELTLSKIG